MAMTRRLKTLGDKVTTDKQLTNALRFLPDFRGVYDRVGFFKIYPSMRANESVILNLDPKYRNGGTHWVALKISHSGDAILYKDSFGAPPPEDFYSDLGRVVLYGTNINQGLDEENCGRRSAEFLTRLVNAGKDDKKIFYQIA